VRTARAIVLLRKAASFAVNIVKKLKNRGLWRLVAVVSTPRVVSNEHAVAMDCGSLWQSALTIANLLC